jgi:crotonobetainyl-CoA:carnitine CoA-transferase CaiB-like acyl-CoA transferase
VSSGPLHGMTVIDISQQLPGPYCSLLLAGLGAEVIKVEPLGGDTARHVDPRMFERVSRGKRSIRLNLKAEEAQVELQSLVRDAGVFIEGFRPGVAARLGCDFARLAQLNPDLVYCSVSGFGQTGPWAKRPTHDLSLQAIAGALRPSDTVETVGVPWVDLGVATTAAFLIASHWRTGMAVHLDLAMLDVVSSWAGVKPGAVYDVQPTYGTFTSADGTTFALALLEDDMWQRLCRALELDDWSAEAGLGEYAARMAVAAEVRRRVQDEIGRRSASEVAALAASFDLPLDEIQDAASDPTNDQVEWRKRLALQDGLIPVGPGVGRALGQLAEG